jgi:hypothetical protein
LYARTGIRLMFGTIIQYSYLLRLKPHNNDLNLFKSFIGTDN